MLLSLVAGIQIMRQVIGLEALTENFNPELEKVLHGLVSQLVEA